MKRVDLFLFLLVWLMACTPTAVEPEVATAVPLATSALAEIVTAVATPTIANSATPLPTNTPLPTEIPATVTLAPTEPAATKLPRATPTIEVPETPQAYTVSANGVQFVMDTRLATAVYPEQSHDDLQYRRFLFAPEGFCRDVGCVTVYDVESFRAETPGGDIIMDEFAAALARNSATYIPTWGAAIMLQAQEKSLAFGTINGVRAVVMRGQNIFWANNDEIVYDFHGLTANGRYYINITIPIDAPILMDRFDPAQNTNPNAIPTPELSTNPDEEVAQMVQYNATAESQLVELPEAAFLPALTLLDALVTSLIITE